MSAVPGEAAPTFDVVATITNPPNHDLWYSHNYTNNGIRVVEFTSTSITRGVLHFNFRSPAEIPNDRHEDTLTLHICIDDLCREDVRGSPVEIRTTYDIQGGTRATLSRNQVDSATDARVTSSHREVVALQYERPLADIPAFEVTHSQQALVSVHPRNISPTQTDIEILYQPGTALSFGPHEDTISVNACYDSSCSKKLLGSPFTIRSTHDVTIFPEAGYDALEVASRVRLGHDVIDAEFSRVLNMIVMVSGNPTNALYLYDVSTGVEQQQLLEAVPRAVSIGPDGVTAAVGHVNRISIVDLAIVGQAGAPAPVMLDVDTDMSDLVLDANGKVHVFPNRFDFDPPRSIDIATNTMLEGTGLLIRGARARLHPSGTVLYEAHTIFTPTNIAKWDISTGVATRLYASPHHGEHEVCGNLWFNDGADLVYTACGNVFTSSPVPADDLQYFGKLELTNTATTGLYSHVIRSLSLAASGNEIALVEVMNGCESVGFGGPCYTHFALNDRTTLSRQAIYAIQPVTVDNVIYAQLGYHVFHDAANGRKYLISRLQSMADSAAAFYLSVIE
ncbi:MAG: hypothetical protein WD793_05745 [Steroidobacteraceae bacterium]